MRRIAPISCALLLFVAACGGSAPPPSTVPSGAPASPAGSASLASSKPAASTAAAPAASGAASASTVSGNLSWYTLFASNSTAPIIQKFNQLHPDVKVAATQFGSAEMLERIRAEYKSGVNNFDVMDVVFGFYADQLTDEGILGQFHSPEAKNYPAGVNVEGPKGTYDYFARSPNGLCTNKDLKPQPATWDDLLKPEFKGQIAMQTPLTVSGPRSWLVDSRDYWGDAKWQQWWHSLGQQSMVFTPTPTDALQMIVRGEKGAMIHCPATLGFAQFSKGAPIKWLAPDPTTVSDIAIATASKAKNPKAAQAFVDYMLSKEGQQGVADNLVLLTYLPGTKQNDFFTGIDKAKQISSPSKFQQDELAKDANLTFYQDFAKKELNVR